MHANVSKLKLGLRHQDFIKEQLSMVKKDYYAGPILFVVLQTCQT